MDYEDKLKAIEGVDLREPNSSFNPRQGLEANAHIHRERARVFRFMEEYTTPEETFRLSEADLRSLELLDRYL